jgi:hypothetical protein
MPDSFGFFRIRARARDARALADQLQQHTVARWQSSGVQCWGIWQGLFGVASNELLIMAAAPGDRPDENFAAALPDDADVVDTLSLLSTARPETVDPLVAEGLYVFRLFDVRLRDCEQIVALSRQAWETFEATDRYASRPRGLFRPRGHGDDTGRMLLVTWYDGFDSWQTSRTPAPQARDNFQQRHALTRGTIAYATRLLPAHVP